MKLLAPCTTASPARRTLLQTAAARPQRAVSSSRTSLKLRGVELQRAAAGAWGSPGARKARSHVMARTRSDERNADDMETEGLLAESSSQADLSNAPYDLWMTVLCFLFPALGGGLFGYDIGATSAALVSITSATLSGTSWYNLSSFQSGVVVSCSLFGALGGSVGALKWGDKMGRKRELLLGAACYGVASVAMSLAPSLTALLFGHTLYGVGIGFAMHAAPAYIAETAPAQVRGLLISLKEAFIVAGILLGYLIGARILYKQTPESEKLDLAPPPSG